MSWMWLRLIFCLFPLFILCLLLLACVLQLSSFQFGALSLVDFFLFVLVPTTNLSSFIFYVCVCLCTYVWVCVKCCFLCMRVHVYFYISPQVLWSNHKINLSLESVFRGKIASRLPFKIIIKTFFQYKIRLDICTQVRLSPAMHTDLIW